jgi:hypothetical protein
MARYRGALPTGRCSLDAWCAVRLLLHLSRAFPAAVVFVADNDGDFLLFEAAAELPAWCDPDMMGGRVALSRGHLLLVPPTPPPAAGAEALWGALHLRGAVADATPLPMDAIEHDGPGRELDAGPVTRPQTLELLASVDSHAHLLDHLIRPRVDEAIARRADAELRNARATHRAVVVLPEPVAWCLRVNPRLAHRALSTLHAWPEADVENLCDNMKRFDPAAAPVRIAHSFSQYTYAMAHFTKPPKVCCAPEGLPPAVAAALELGAKLTLGLEAAWRDDAGGCRAAVNAVCNTVAKSTADAERRFGGPLVVVAAHDHGDSAAWLNDYAKAAADDDAVTEKVFAEWASAMAAGVDDDDGSSSDGSSDDADAEAGAGAPSAADEAAAAALFERFHAGCVDGMASATDAELAVFAESDQLRQLLAQFTAQK